MNAQAIVYTSATGFTARYAGLLAEASDLPLHPLEQAEKTLSPETQVLYLGWLCAGTVQGLAKAARHFTVRAVCAVGMSPPDPAYTAKLRRPEKLWETPLFYLRGGYAPERLRGIYKPMMAFMTKTVTRAPAQSPEERAMQEAFLSGGDWVSPEALAPVLNWLEAGSHS